MFYFYPARFNRWKWPFLALLSLILLLSLPWSTLPGPGLTVTLNLLVWLWVSVVTLILIGCLRRHRLQGGKITVWLVSGGVLMTLPLGWTPHFLQTDALYRIAALWTMAGFLWLLLQYPLRGAARRRIYALVALAGVIQVLLSIWQLLWPNLAGAWLGYDFLSANGRPLGSLLQVNLLGSWIATSLACAVWLSLSASGASGRRWASGCSVLLSAGLMLTQSRSALAGGGLATACLLAFAYRNFYRRRAFMAALCIAAGLIIGQIGLQLRPPLLTSVATAAASKTLADARPDNVDERLDWNRRRSGEERQLMLAGAADIISRHPLAGSGMGSFETEFPQALLRRGIANPFTVTVMHPHNELLYVWSEGGIAALGGLLFWLAIWWQPFRGRRALRLTGSSAVTSRGALTLPLMFHVMTEFPLWLSAGHAVLLLLLIRLALPICATRRSGSNKTPGTVRHSAAAMVAAISLAGMLFIATGLQSAFWLRDAESFEMRDSTPFTRMTNPYAQPDRLLFDTSVNALMEFQQTRHPQWLRQFKRDAEKWLAHHNDANLTATMMQLAEMQQHPDKVKYWRWRGCLSFARDPRFTCSEWQLPSNLAQRASQ